MTTRNRSQYCEGLSGLLLSDKDYQQRGWTHQYIWGLDINTHVITKMLTEQLGRQGFGLYLVEGDLYKIWAPSDFGEVGHTFSVDTLYSMLWGSADKVSDRLCNVQEGITDAG